MVIHADGVSLPSDARAHADEYEPHHRILPLIKQSKPKLQPTHKAKPNLRAPRRSGCLIRNTVGIIQAKNTIKIKIVSQVLPHPLSPRPNALLLLSSQAKSAHTTSRHNTPPTIAYIHHFQPTIGVRSTNGLPQVVLI